MPEQFLRQYAPGDVVEALEATLGSESPNRRLDTLVALAWHLRQRDSARAQQYANEATALLAALLPVDTPDPIPHQYYHGRLRLVRAELHALQSDLVGAQAEADQALAWFTQRGESRGMGDAHTLLALIANERGDEKQVSTDLQLALEAYQAAQDLLRVASTRAHSLANLSFSDLAGAAAGLAQYFEDTLGLDDAVMVWVMVCRANIAGLTDNPGESIKCDLQAHQLALNVGMTRQAIVCATNAAESFAMLGELDAALEWAERAVNMARATHWPALTGVCLLQMGDVMRQLRRTAEARTLLQEAQRVMGAVAGSRNYENTLCSLGQLALDEGDNADALNWFGQSEHRPGANSLSDVRMKVLRGQATALSRLGRAAEAVDKAEQALALARDKGHADEQMRLLRVFAELHQRHALPVPERMTEPSPELHYLLEALRIVRTMGGYLVPIDLLHQLASAYARCGHFQPAYEYSVAANEARNTARVEEAQNRALALQIRQEIDRARSDSENHRKHAATLQATNATLETLGQIGREITASLDADAVFETLHRHVANLLDAASFAIYLLEADGLALSIVFGVEAGRSQPVSNRVMLDSPTSITARCARERREIVITEATKTQSVQTVPGTLRMQSMLFAPMEIGNRLLGVITIQSQRPDAYGERECSIFRNLCAYAAIALDNAAAYSGVEAARHKAALQEQELRVAATAFESREGLLITDGDRTILRVNKSFLQLTGYAAIALVGNSPDMILAQSDAPAPPTTLESVGDAPGTAGSWKGEAWILCRTGETLAVELSMTAVRSDAGTVTNYVYSVFDITARKIAEDEIRNLAFYDALTRLPNRRMLMDRLALALANSARSTEVGSLLFIDLDNFKKLNDTRGHDIGDLLLQQVAQRLGACIREGDTAARLGGDEFVILLQGLGTQVVEAAEKAEIVAGKVLKALNQPYWLHEQEHHNTPSIGVCLFRGQNETADELMKQADLAMYESKAAGRNAIRFFDPEMQAAITAHAALEADMRQALVAQQFILHYQVQVDSAGKTVGAEALVRWHHPVRGMVSPGAFIPLAEETGLILQLGEWVLETACRQLHQWAAEPGTAGWTVAVNISARQFREPHFVDQVVAVLARTGADPTRLKLELTESLLLKDVEEVIGKMNALITHGVRFSLDDFGTGYSSLSYLKRLPLDQLKIDQSFVRDIFVDANDLAIVRAIVTLGHSLGLAVIAEGVETVEQRQFLESSGCTTFQGYLFGRPVSPEQLSVSQS